MPRSFKSCPLEIKSNGELKREHLGFSSSATKNFIFHYYDVCGHQTWHVALVTHHEGLPLIKSHEPWSGGYSKPRDKLKPLYLQCIMSGYQTCRVGGLHWGVPFIYCSRMIFNQVVLLRLRDGLKNLYLHFQKTYGR